MMYVSLDCDGFRLEYLRFASSSLAITQDASVHAAYKVRVSVNHQRQEEHHHGKYGFCTIILLVKD
jgi:hypothetical protein